MNAYDNLRSDLENLFERVRSGTLRDTDAIDEADVRMDGDAGWVADMIDRKSIHDPDYRVFSRLHSDAGTILDVGANWGYSIGSIRATGCTLPILSFEILAAYRNCLEAAKQKLVTGYDYIICGVGSASGQTDVYVPTLNGLALTSLASASTQQFNVWTVRNVLDYAENYMAKEARFIPRILRLTARIDRIDRLLHESRVSVPTNAIAALKIDVEGLEGDALQGASDTLSQNRPLLLVEGGNRSAKVQSVLDQHKYIPAVRQGDVLSLSEGTSEGSNGFFLHPVWFDTYRRHGLLK